MTDHIPDPGKHRTMAYGHYANRVRGDRAHPEPTAEAVKETLAKKRRCTPSWARLISKVFHADPLTCRKCGGKLKVIAYLHDTVSIRRVLEHLGLGQPEEQRPPPPDIRYVPVDEEERPLGQILNRSGGEEVPRELLTHRCRRTRGMLSAASSLLAAGQHVGEPDRAARTSASQNKNLL